MSNDKKNTISELEKYREENKIKCILPNDLDMQFGLNCESHFDRLKELLFSEVDGQRRYGKFTEEEEIEIHMLISFINMFKFYQ